MLVSLEHELTHDPDARETFLYAVNQCLRFAGMVGAETADHGLLSEAEALAVAITGTSLATFEPRGMPNVTLCVGTKVIRDRPAVTVCSEGWLARAATSAADVEALPHAKGAPNVIGALAGACLGVSQVFHFLTGLDLSADAVEVSLWTLAEGALGSQDGGPRLPARLNIDAILVGCGGVMHGFIYALKRLPLSGRARAVDRQRLREENLGPYVLATIDAVGLKKADLIKDTLPDIEVTTYDEDFYPLFTTRLERGYIPLAPVVVAGLDEVAPRHIIQRLLPKLLIDMGAGGETSQLIVKSRVDDGACVVELLDLPEGQDDAYATELARLATDSGFAPELIRDAMDSPISAEDVAAAPAELREDMNAARRKGDVRCGFVRQRALDYEQSRDDFSAAVPFVLAFSGLVACGEFVKAAIGETTSMRYQFSFVSMRGRATRLLAGQYCDCRRVL